VPTRTELSTGQWLGKPLSPACERAHVLITRHIDGELAPGDGRELRAHLAACTSCRRTLETQAEQSQFLADSLKALWAADDSFLKKKIPGAHELWISLRRALPRIAGCTAVAACILLYATRVDAPSDASAKQRAPGSAGRDKAQIEESAVEKNQKTPESVRADLLSTPQEISPPSTPRTDSLANLNFKVPLKPLPGIELKYSILTGSGTREEGCVTVLGDVLAGKAVVRIQTNFGETIEAPQADLDTAFNSARRAEARKLLRECLAPSHRKRIEEAIRKLSEIP
jgi:hypothetical protein